MKCTECGNEDPGQMLGVEVPGVYDGVLYWVCGVCSFAWPRDWSGFGRRAELAQGYADAHNLTREDLCAGCGHYRAQHFVYGCRHGVTTAGEVRCPCPEFEPSTNPQEGELTK